MTIITVHTDGDQSLPPPTPTPAQVERAIVAFLRARADRVGSGAQALYGAADAIARGEHRG